MRGLPRPRVELSRGWLEQERGTLRALLPGDQIRFLTTADLTDARGAPVDVLAALQISGNPQSPLQNIAGLVTSAAAAAGVQVDEDRRPAWPGFDEVWVPINDHLQLSGRLGLADGDAAADCLIFVPGLFGDNTSPQTRSIALALRGRGYHVLALEGRAAGLTEQRYPNVSYSFGLLEAGDLLAVDEWLLRQPRVQRTGLLGYCWGANTALLAAWEDARRDDDADVAASLAGRLRKRDGRPHFEAGVIACSPPLRFDPVIERLERPVSTWADPAYAYLAQVVETRMRLKGDPEPGHSILQLRAREMIRGHEFTASDIPAAAHYLDLMPAGREGAKLNQVRVPTLIVYAADDPIAAAQPVADLVAKVENPQVAALVLNGGGHCGFAALAPRCFYTLVTGFYSRPNGLRDMLVRQWPDEFDVRSEIHASYPQ